MSAHSCTLCIKVQLLFLSTCLLPPKSFGFFSCVARSERYHHLASDEDDETNDEESSLEIRRFSSWSNRFSKVGSFLQSAHFDNVESLFFYYMCVTELSKSYCLFLVIDTFSLTFYFKLQYFFELS